MKAYIVTLFGHRELNAHTEVEKRLYSIVQDLIRSKEYVEFYIGRDGEFDVFSASIIKRAQKALGSENSEIILVLPYKRRNIEFYEQYYNSVLIPDSISHVHPKQAITKRNRWMVEKCDLFICYAEHKTGGTSKALQYTRKLGKNIINLAIDRDTFHPPF